MASHDTSPSVALLGEAIARGVSLGKPGEEQWRGLLGAYELERRRGVAICVAGEPQALAEVRRRLAGLAPELRRLSPTADIVERTWDLGAAHAGPSATRLPIAWIQASDDTFAGGEEALATVWKPALQRLNQARENLAEQGPVFLVLAGPRSLLPIVRRVPDLFSVAGPVADLGDRVDLIRAAHEPLGWLHISDLHVRAPGDWRQDVVLRDLLRDLPRLLERADPKPQLVFATGDFAWSGKKEELEGAEQFLRELMDKLALDPKEALFLVPGNHDVDRSRIGKMALAHQEKLLAARGEEFRKEIGEALADQETMRAHGARLGAYADFTARLLGAARAVSPERPFRTDVREMAGFRVGIASLASAWLCGPKDELQVVVGERQVRESLGEIADADLRIVLVHHPTRCWREEDQSISRELIRKSAHLLLHGHVHMADLESRLTPSASLVISGAGAAYTGPEPGWPHGFQIARVDPRRGELVVRAFTYSQRGGGFWTPDSGVDPSAPDGVLRLPFSLEGVAAAVPAAPDALAARLAKVAASVYGQVKFIGLPAHAPKPAAALSDLFVPLDLVEDQAPAGPKATVTLASLEKDLFAASPGKGTDAARMVVLGAPGSGKSTLCRYLAVRTSEHEGIAPLVLVLREYMRQQPRDGGTLGLLEFLAAESRKVLQVQVSEENLQDLCVSGHAILILDGFDEVTPAARERLRDMVQAFAASYPRTAILATSRIAGYGDAPLDRRRFRRLELEPFDDAALAAFILRWYEVAEPDDARARDRRRADLQEALDSEPRAKELARNPLFATLIALVHQFEARLPGERAQLYELCVRMLVETWPQAAGRRFADARLDERRQRTLLEQLALRLQGMRTDHSEVAGAAASADARLGIAVDRGFLTDLLVELLRGQSSDRSEGEDRRLIDGWLDYLAAGTGILVEQEPGIFAFFHLSVMEYMAGQALLEREGARGDQAIADFVQAHHEAPVWEETLLLMLGSRGRRVSLVDLVARSLLSEAGGASNLPTFAFLVGMLREEVDLSSSVRGQILHGIAALAVDLEQSRLEPIASRLNDVVRFSKLHGQPVSSWFNERFGKAHDGDLIGAALVGYAAGTAEASCLAALNARVGADRSSAAKALLPMSPTRPFGVWAVENAQEDAIVAWAFDCPLTLGGWRAITLLTEPRSNLAHFALAAALIARGAKIASITRHAASARASHHHSSIPLCIRWTGPYDSGVTPLIPGWISPGEPSSEEVLTAAARDFARKFSTEFPHLHGGKLDALLRSYSFLASIEEHEPLGIDFSKPFGPGFASDWLGDRVVEINPPHAPRATPPTQQTIPLGFFSLPHDQSRFELYAGLALAAGDAPSAATARLVASARVQNRWVWILFDPLLSITSSNVDVDAHPDYQALFIALGLAQYQTTWIWPDGDHWARWFAGGPPEHWLPAYFWHCCWVVGEPNNGEHRRNAEACLDRGDLPELVARLRQYPVEPPPPEYLALFSDERA